jgi:hypothetical protein
VVPAVRVAGVVPAVRAAGAVPADVAADVAAMGGGVMKVWSRMKENAVIVAGAARAPQQRVLRAP